MSTDIPPLLDILQQIPDPRRRQGQRYPLQAILALMCAAAMCGYTSYSAMTEWGRHYGPALLQALGFKNDRAPCKSWLSQLLPRLDVMSFEARITEWVESVLEWLPPSPKEKEVFSADGKALRGSRKQEAPGSYLLSILGSRLGLVLHQRAVPEGDDDHTNEIPILEGVLRELSRQGRLRDRIWTMDALHTQRKHAEVIVEGDGDYVMVVKGNQGTLHQDIGLLFEPSKGFPPDGRADTVDRRHGRVELRRMAVSTALNEYIEWPGMQQVFCIRRKTQITKRGKTREETVYGITSLAPEEADAACLLSLVRRHWHIENRLHWVRDVTFDEDRSTVRRANTPQIMAAIRNLAIGLIRLTGADNVASKCREFAAKPWKALALIGIDI